jgi:hypothetical protein
MRARPLRLLVLSLFLGPAASYADGPASIPAPGTTAATAGQGLVAPGRAPDLQLLFSGDVIGFLEPCG